MKRLFIPTVLLVLLLAINLPSVAQILWGEEGVSLRNYEQIIWNDWAVKNSAGDVYVLWEENNGPIPYYFCQKYDAQGQQLWAENVEIHHGPSIYVLMCVATDDALIVTYDSAGEYINPLIRAQKIDVDGNILWEPLGVPVGETVRQVRHRAGADHVHKEVLGQDQMAQLPGHVICTFDRSNEKIFLGKILQVAIHTECRRVK